MNTATATPTADVAPIHVIEGRANAYAIARTALAEHVTLIRDEQDAIKRRHLKRLRTLVGHSAEALNALMSEIEAHPECFEKPRSRVLAGIQLGYRKGKGKLVYEDEERVVAAIHKLLPDQAEVLLKVTEKPAKDSLTQLDAATLKKLGVTIEGTGDVIFVKPADSEVDKLVDALLGDLTEAEIE
jgi:hypothetical protein